MRRPNLIFSLYLILTTYSSALIIPLPPLSLPLAHSHHNVSLSLPHADDLITPTYCKNQALWSPRRLIIEDCTTALHGFYTVQVQPHLRTEFEFLGIHAVPMYKRVPDVAVTPRKYESGTCVLAIAMINFYPASILRERGPGPFLDNDVARYIAVWTKLHDIIFKCQGPGWGAVGNGGYIGVFVWTKDSEMDLRTPSGMTSSS